MLGPGTVKPIVSYTITATDAAGPFNKTIPEDATEQSKLPGLYYTSVLEELGGKFHSAQALLKRLNPHARFIAGENISRVPNVLGAEQATRAQTGPVKIVVSKKKSVLMVYDREGQNHLLRPGDERQRARPRSRSENGQSRMWCGSCSTAAHPGRKR